MAWVLLAFAIVALICVIGAFHEGSDDLPEAGSLENEVR